MIEGATVCVCVCVCTIYYSVLLILYSTKRLQTHTQTDTHRTHSIIVLFLSQYCSQKTHIHRPPYHPLKALVSTDASFDRNPCTSECLRHE